jgi:hypothetical protein
MSGTQLAGVPYTIRRKGVQVMLAMIDLLRFLAAVILALVLLRR